MPEYREILAFLFTLLRWLDSLSAEDLASLILYAIWTDATIPEGKEMTRIDPASPGAHGHVYKLNASSTIVRGPLNCQKPIWPTLHAAASKDRRDWKPMENLDGLRLCGVSRTPRTVALDFGKVTLHVQPLTHTMVQIYTRSQWDDEIAQVSCLKAQRGFRVAMALDLGQSILAFLTFDNVWTPLWVQPQDPIPPQIQMLDVYDDYNTFLEGIAALVRKRHTRGFHSTQNLATVVVKDHGEVFGGVGAYTVEELFFMAGISPFILEGELFSCPSRVARLCEAFWTYAHKSHTELNSWMSPSFVGWVLAPTKEHRVSYSRWLYVHGKQHVRMPIRMKLLLLDYEERLKGYKTRVVPFIRSQDPLLYDVFEPTFIRAASEHKNLVLSSLIWGKARWESLNGWETGTAPASSDPLTRIYTELGLLDARTYLHPSAYCDALLLPNDDLGRALVETKFYECKTIKSLPSVWTISSVFPRMLVAECSKTSIREKAPYCDLFELAPTKVRNSRTFVRVVESRQVAVGPLEYCSIGRRVPRAGPKGRSNWVLAVCNDSPLLEDHFRHRLQAKKNRIADGRHKAGHRKVASRKASQPGGWGPKLNAQARKNPLGSNSKEPPEALYDGAGHAAGQKGQKRKLVSSPISVGEVLQGLPNSQFAAAPVTKKRRLSADAKLAQGLLC
ncbi:hypothetical protein C8Q80DRAFT_1174915 [Daedaleopsis nitida]|nr:hypothetical protein C8Q80DRAFT_1174915 [Daedaleopsis nitida]